MSSVCQSALEGLAEAATGPLPPERWLALRAHLQACPGCRRRWEEIQETVAWLRELPDPQPPGGLWDELRRQVTARRPRPWRAAAAALVLVGLLGVLAPRAPRPAGEEPSAVVSDAVREVMPEVLRLVGRWRAGFEPEVDRWWAGGE